MFTMEEAALLGRMLRFLWWVTAGVAIGLVIWLGYSLAGSASMTVGVTSLIYLSLLAFICLPGLPLGFALFGRTHPASWVTGLLLGYAAATVLVATATRAGHATTIWLSAAWILSCGVSVAMLGADRIPWMPLPAFGRRARGSLFATLLLVPILMVPPLSRIGSVDSEGNHRYRAYFTVDFLWHSALTAELAKDEPLPRNPFAADQPVHYYWAYFRVPATLAARTGIPVPTVLGLNALATAVLLISAIYLAAWAALPAWPATTAVAVALTVVAPSLEGWAAIADISRRRLPLAEVRDLNIDAVAAWAWKGLRIDDLPRTFWYTPQHGFACALGLVGLVAAIAAPAGAPFAAILTAGCALGASVAFSPLIGIAFCGVYGAAIVASAASGRRSLRDVIRHAGAALPVLAALAWCRINQVDEGAGQALQAGVSGLARHAPLMTLLVQIGGLLVPLFIGLAAASPAPRRSIVPATAGVLAGLSIMFLLALRSDAAWVGFRGGNVLFACAPALIARGLASLTSGGSGRRAAVLTALIVFAGVPTTAIDEFNAQDVANTHLSRDPERVRGSNVEFNREQEFHLTVVLSPEQYAALTWIREHTPSAAVVQAEPLIRGRELFVVLPALAERRMATGRALPLLPQPFYDERSERVRRIFSEADPSAAGTEAHTLGINYLYVDELDRGAYANAAKFDSSPQYFRPVFRAGDVGVYQVR